MFKQLLQRWLKEEARTDLPSLPAHNPDALIEAAIQSAFKAFESLEIESPKITESARWMSHEQAVIYVRRAISDLVDARWLRGSDGAEPKDKWMQVKVNGELRNPILWLDLFFERKSFYLMDFILTKRACAANQIPPENVISSEIIPGACLKLKVKIPKPS